MTDETNPTPATPTEEAPATTNPTVTGAASVPSVSPSAAPASIAQSADEVKTDAERETHTALHWILSEMGKIEHFSEEELHKLTAYLDAKL